jgi:nitrate reductase assembly molybdenum cofactor insertion protein NarJ
MKHKPTAQLFQKLADDFRAAVTVETVAQYSNTFDRAHSRITVELCHGTWHTFYREFRSQGDASIKAHASRDAAREYARAFLG